MKIPVHFWGVNKPKGTLIMKGNTKFQLEIPEKKD